MPAKLETRNYIGTVAGDGATEFHMRFKNADNSVPDILDPVVHPLVGVTYSWWKTIALHCTQAPATSISNVKIYPERTRLFVSAYGVFPGAFAKELYSVNISDLDNPTLHKLVSESVGSWIGDVWSSDIDVDGDFFYTVDRQERSRLTVTTDPNDVLSLTDSDAFRTWDIQNLEDPQIVSTIQLSVPDPPLGSPPQRVIRFYADVKSYNSQYVFVWGGSEADAGPVNAKTHVWTIDVTDKNNPVEAARLDEDALAGDDSHTGRARAHIDGTTAYVWWCPRPFGGISSVAEYDLTDPLNVNFVSRKQSPTGSPEWGDIVQLTDTPDFLITSSYASNRIERHKWATKILDSFGATLPHGIMLLDDTYLYVAQGFDLDSIPPDTTGQIAVYDYATWETTQVFNQVPIATIRDGDHIVNPQIFSLHPDNANIAFVTTTAYEDELNNIIGANRLVVLDIETPNFPSVKSSTVLQEDLRTRVFEHSVRVVAKPSWPGVTVYVGDETTSTYVQASGTEGTGDELVANHSQIIGRTDFYTFGHDSPKTVSGSIGATVGRVSDYVVFQLELSTAALVGDLPKERWVWLYDEV